MSDSCHMDRIDEREPRMFEILDISRHNRQPVPQQTPHRPPERGKSLARCVGSNG